MMDARRISAYDNIMTIEALVREVDKASRWAASEGRPYSEAVLYIAARRLEQLIPLTVGLPDDPNTTWEIFV